MKVLSAREKARDRDRDRERERERDELRKWNRQVGLEIEEFFRGQNEINATVYVYGERERMYEFFKEK